MADQTTGSDDELSWDDYARFSEALGLDPDPTLSPTERRDAIPRWMCDELIATPAARGKLLEWSTRTPDVCGAITVDLDVMLRSLHFYGDEHVLDRVARLLTFQVPPPVTEYVSRATTFIAVGLSMLGFCSSRIEFGDRPHLVVLGARYGNERFNDALIGHEVGHVWLDEPPPPDARVHGALLASANQYAVPLEDVPADLRAITEGLRQALALNEQQCRALTRAWHLPDLEDVL